MTHGRAMLIGSGLTAVAAILTVALDLGNDAGFALFMGLALFVVIVLMPQAEGFRWSDRRR
jgi:hypothetical protein